MSKRRHRKQLQQKSRQAFNLLPPHGRSDKSVEKFLRKLLNIPNQSYFWWSTKFDEGGFLNGEILVIDDSNIILHEVFKSAKLTTYKLSPEIIRANETYLRANLSDLAECKFLAETAIDAACQMDPNAKLSVYLEF